MTTITSTLTDTNARTWIGCLTCYNAGDLVGDWFAASIADEVTPEEVHGSHNVATNWHESPHEEMWVMDHEGLPISGECSPAIAAEWARLLDEVDEHQRDAFHAWVAAGDYSHNTSGLASVADFEDAYAGEWDSFQQYAEEFADGTGMLADVPAEFAAYFNWSAWARDIAYDHTTADAPHGGVYVFRTF